MAYLTGSDDDLTVEEDRQRFRDYRNYLESIRPRLSPSVYEFAAAAWHYDPRDPRCPHDAWVESIEIIEPAAGARKETRTIEIRMRLLGAYHDGHIELRYLKVSRYASDVSPGLIGGHGDWLIDEIGYSAPATVTHTIEFINGALHIECEDIRYQWVPLEQNEQG